MNELMSQVDDPCRKWRKTSHSGGGNNCVELTVLVAPDAGNATLSAT